MGMVFANSDNSVLLNLYGSNGSSGITGILLANTNGDTLYGTSSNYPLTGDTGTIGVNHPPLTNS